VFTSVLVFELIQTGFVFSTEPLSFNFGRLNPAQNLKRIFSPRMLVETAKNVAKLAAYAALAGLLIYAAGWSWGGAITDAFSLADAAGRLGLRLMILFVGAAVVFAIFDQLIVRRDFFKRMRMSRRELRREHRDREGEPRMKQKRKQLHADFAKASQSVRNIRGADLLITNPTHYAVALRYRPTTMEAPHVVSRGAHEQALRLKRLAFVYGLTIVEDPPLARLLYHRCQIDQQIPEPAFQRVADLYLAMRRKPQRQSDRSDHA
jgi:flagellar biosynthesis protein FlhB